MKGHDMQQVQSEIGVPAVVVVDSLQLRRAGLVGLLQAWAHGLGISVMAVGPEEIQEGAAQGRNVHLTILNLGGIFIGNPSSQQSIKSLKKWLPTAPLVIMSDWDQAGESIAAFQIGARGYIPATIEPAIALKALSFIMAGGSFFPPTALLEPSSSNGHARAAPGRTARRGSFTSDCGPTQRQQDIFDLLPHDLFKKMIVRKRDMRMSRVKVYVQPLMKAASCGLNRGANVGSDGESCGADGPLSDQPNDEPLWSPSLPALRCSRRRHLGMRWLAGEQ
jgi:DNA-binding NarL/FixJ family response regulator